MTIKEKILKSIQPVVENSKFVTINQDKITQLAQELKDQPIPVPDEFEFAGSPEETVQYIFFLDSIQGCLWQVKGKQRWYYKHEGGWIKGYFAFAYTIKKALENNRQLLDANYLSQISFEEFKKIFPGGASSTQSITPPTPRRNPPKRIHLRQGYGGLPANFINQREPGTFAKAGKNELQLLPERHKIIQENFSILNQKYNGQAASLIKQAQGDINQVVEALIKDFPSFRDMAHYKNQEVFFLKRAQIFPSDVYYAFHGQGLGEFKSLDDLTIFPDYKLPQLLQAEGVLEYTEEILAKIKNEDLLEYGSKDEIEIRALSIYACELLVQELAKHNRQINHNDLDRLLWYISKTTKYDLAYHKTITTFY